MLARRLLLALLTAAFTACGDEVSGPLDRNEPPLLIAIVSNQHVPDSVTLRLSAYFADPDGDPLAFTAESSDTEVARIEVAGEIARIYAVAAGSSRVTVTATDPGGLTASQGFTVIVPDRAPQPVEAIPGAEALVGEEVTVGLSAYFVDPDQDPLTFTAESSDTTVAAVSVSGDSVTVRPIAPGMATITVTATDPGGLTATQAFAITVPNRPPHATDALPHIELRVGDEAAADLSTHFADPDGQPLAFTAESSDGAVAAVAVSGQEMGLTALAKGVASVTVTATDPGGLTAAQTFSVTVPNRAPETVGTMPDIELPVGEADVIDAARYFSDPDGDSLAIAAASSDTSVATVSVSGDSVTVRPIAPGMATITVTATDPGGLTASQAFAIAVPNRPPHATDALPHVELRVGDEAAADLSTHFADPDGQPLAFTAESSDTTVAAVSVSGDSVTVRPIAPGMATITVTATDPGGLTATQAFAITVPNRPPHATDALPHIELRVGDEAAADLSTHFADPDGQPLAFTAESSDGAVAAVAVSGQEMGLTALAKGVASVTVTATDPGGLTAAQTFSVTVPNRAPETVGTMPDIELPVGEADVIDAARYFSDPDGDSLAIAAASSDTSVATVSVSGDSVTVRPIAPGMATITVTATDPGGLTASQAFAIAVPNRPPHATDALPHVELRVGDEAAADLSTHFADPDGQPLAFTAESSDDAVATVRVSGQEMRLTAIAKGVASVTVTATDPGGLTATQTFSVTVPNPRPPNRAPETIGTMPDIGLQVGGEAVVDASRHFSDPDGDPLAFAAESSDTSVASVGVSDNSVTVRPIAPGMATITVTATDPGALTATQTFSVTVLNPRPPNRAPETIGTMPDIGLQVGGEAVVDASRYFSDPDGDPLAFAAESSDGSRALPVTSGHDVRVRALAQGTVTITVTASDRDGLSATQTFTVAVTGRGGGDGFSISLHFTDAVPAAYRPTLESAAGHLMAILSGTEWDDVAINGTRGCSGIEVALGTVDDVAIVVDVADLDGDLGVAARAGRCIRRTDSAPVLGSIRLDRADLAVLAQYNDLFEIMVHEIIHVLGFGPRWVLLGLLDQDSDPVFDPHFTGPRAIAAFDAAGGADYTGEKVPIEPGQGHWRESVFGSELMDAIQIINRREPLSAISLEAFVDMGFAVDLSYAEPFQLPGGDRTAAEAERGTAVEVSDEVDRGPVVVVDRNGRTVRIIPPR